MQNRQHGKIRDAGDRLNEYQKIAEPASVEAERELLGLYATICHDIDHLTSTPI